MLKDIMFIIFMIFDVSTIWVLGAGDLLLGRIFDSHQEQSQMEATCIGTESDEGGLGKFVC